jgi:hypothetical protein
VVLTTCGHVFCKECILACMKVDHKCPNCRKKCTVRGVRPVYF